MTFYKSKALESQEKVTNEELAAVKENKNRNVVDLPKGKKTKETRIAILKFRKLVLW